DDSVATPAPKIHREDCRIRWDRPAQQVHNQIRGLSPHPGAWTMHGENMLKVYRSRIAEEAERAGTPGQVIQADERLVVACGTGAVELIDIQQEGKRRLHAEEFLRGYAINPGDVLT